jgi:hypothetical protein
VRARRLALAAALVFCGLGIALTWRVERARVLRALFAVYAAACLLSYAVPSGVGENIARMRFAAVPLAVLTLSLRRWRPLPVAVLALGLAVSWNATPLAGSLARSAADPSSSAAYWRPAVTFLHRSLTPDYRAEAVDTSGHWAAVYLARAGIPLARGWFRQDDFPQNELLYDPLGPRAYLAWLHRLGVRYVVLTDAPQDYSSREEARLLESGRSGLPVAYRSRHVTVYSVPGAVPIVTGPAHPAVLAVTDTTLTLELHAAGRYRVAVRYSPYLAAPGACVAASPDGMTGLVASRPGRLELAFAVTPGRALDALAGSKGSCG